MRVTINDNSEPGATECRWGFPITELSLLARLWISNTSTASSGISRASNTLRTIVLGELVTEIGIPEIMMSGDTRLDSMDDRWDVTSENRRLDHHPAYQAEPNGQGLPWPRGRWLSDNSWWDADRSAASARIAPMVRSASTTLLDCFGCCLTSSGVTIVEDDKPREAEQLWSPSGFLGVTDDRCMVHESQWKGTQLSEFDGTWPNLSEVQAMW